MPKDLLDPNPFAKPIMAKTGNLTAREIYTSVGFALDRWERCEIGFAVIYGALILPAGDDHVLHRAFGTITAPTTRQEMIWNAGDAYFARHKNHELHANLRHLLNLYKSAAPRRNEIAHAMVDGVTSYKVVNNAAVPLPTAWFLVPSIFSTRKTEMHMAGPKYRLSSVEIAHFTACFEELGNRALKTSREIRAFHATLAPKTP